MINLFKSISGEHAIVPCTEETKPSSLLCLITFSQNYNAKAS